MVAAEPVPCAADALVWQHLGQRPCVLTAQELARFFHPGRPQELRSALAERLGMQNERGLQPCLALIERYGPQPELLMALAMTHQPAARDALFRYLDDPGVDRLALLRALAGWGRQVPLAVIEEALQHPGQAMRLAGVELLQFHARLLTAQQLLTLAEPLLGDVRPPVAMAAIHLLQRRNEPLLAGRLAQLLQADPPEPVWEAALHALGSIGTEASITLLLDCWLAYRGTPRAMELLHQLGAQFRHQELLRQRLEELLQEGKIMAAEAAPLLVSLDSTPAANQAALPDPGDSGPGSFG
ncbi:MAG: HEAT repeat domain-containing protein [Synechococcus sp. SB0666_bin_14]|nr:HEAT repeat domain-containing protein [Synechococcus sp. SB0666_bin_14]MYA91245.1 HEAT repeat domain-containing protein [Synechococcus sp. SB0663_bin_10]MYG47320.1 HEAT repeat domain-containing protein [Synechococcus sp. SB0675_bin_6]MYJ59034.1 HEAT repeat domain-containing protein [Synechococcus sp. SB0672_bin_6]MYK91435.1 HEAT repeat domain-containing protein [Synechococcus sp. SB0669_bin_8]